MYAWDRIVKKNFLYVVDTMHFSEKLSVLFWGMTDKEYCVE